MSNQKMSLIAFAATMVATIANAKEITTVNTEQQVPKWVAAAGSCLNFDLIRSP